MSLESERASGNAIQQREKHTHLRGALSRDVSEGLQTVYDANE